MQITLLVQKEVQADSEVQVSSMTIYLPIWSFWILTIIGTLVGLYIIVLAGTYVWIGRKLNQFLNDEEDSFYK